jgi:transposase-like protein
MTARKKYSKEFKLDAIALVVEQKYSRVEASGFGGDQLSKVVVLS